MVKHLARHSERQVMKWPRSLLFALVIIAFSNTITFADSKLNSNNALVGKVEKNQLDELLKTKINCPQQIMYAHAISKLLAGYDMSSLFKGSAQKSTAQAAIIANTLQPKTVLNIKDVLANHDLTIIIDRSGSMTVKDCPEGLSRWQWCSRQASQLAEAASQAASKITLMLFNEDLQIFDNLNPKAIPAIFANYKPSGGTTLGNPLVAQLDRYFATRGRPLIVVVITDGIPQDTMDLPAIIRDASDSLHYVGEVTISFLLVGNQVDAEQFRNLLGVVDNGTIKNGGMVDVIAFKSLVTSGIKQTLFEELKTITQNTNRSKPSPAQNFALGRNLSPSLPTNPFPTYAQAAAKNAAAKNAIQPLAAYSNPTSLNAFPTYSLKAKPK